MKATSSLPARSSVSSSSTFVTSTKKARSSVWPGIVSNAYRFISAQHQGLVRREIVSFLFLFPSSRLLLSEKRFVRCYMFFKRVLFSTLSARVASSRFIKNKAQGHQDCTAYLVHLGHGFPSFRPVDKIVCLY